MTVFYMSINMIIKIKRAVLCVGCLVALAITAFPVSAQEKLNLSLQQAMDMAVERNNTLKNAAMDIQIAQANK